MAQPSDVFEFMAQRDDAIGAHNQAEYDYWRGYIAACCDIEGLDADECEREYQQAQKWARQTMRAAAQ